MKVAGPAFTVEVRPGDNLMIHAALQLAQPGDVIVVDGKGDLSCALTGALMAAHAQKAGIAGFVIDGAVRDTDECARGSFPIFAAGANPNGPLKNSGGRINWPVSLAGTTGQSRRPDRRRRRRRGRGAARDWPPRSSAARRPRWMPKPSA